MCIETNVNSEFDTHEDEGILDQLKFAVQQLKERENFHVLCMAVDEYNGFPMYPEYDLTLVDQDHKLLLAPKSKT